MVEGGTAHGWERSMINLCVLGCPLPPYIKDQGGRPAGPVGRTRRRSPPPRRSRTPLFPTPTRRGKGRGRRRRKGGHPPFLVQFGPEGEGARGLSWPAPLSLSTRAQQGPLTPGGSGNPSGTPVKFRFHPKLFRCPNVGFQYINLYVSAISRLFVMSVIISGTPNYLRYIKTYKLIIPIVIEL